MRTATFKIDTYIRPEEAFHFARKSLAPRFPESAHDHDYFKVFLIESGRTSHWINGEMQTLEPGQFAYFRLQDAHAFRADRTLGYQIINVMFRTETAEHLARWFAEACSAAQSQEFSARARRVSSLPLDAVTNMFAERAKQSPGLHLRNISIRYGSSLPHICSAATSAPSTTWWKPAVLTTTATSIACFGVNTGLRRANTGFEICVIPFRQRRPMSQPAENLLIRFAFQTFRCDLDKSEL